jgi:membrane protein
VKRTVASLDAWQRRHPVGGFPTAVPKRFGEDQGSSLAALIAFYAFYSLFPLLLAFVSILGFVLEGDPSLRDDVLDTVGERVRGMSVLLTHGYRVRESHWSALPGRHAVAG